MWTDDWALDDYPHQFRKYEEHSLIHVFYVSTDGMLSVAGGQVELKSLRPREAATCILTGRK